MHAWALTWAKAVSQSAGRIMLKMPGQPPETTGPTGPTTTGARNAAKTSVAKKGEVITENHPSGEQCLAFRNWTHRLMIHDSMLSCLLCYPARMHMTT